MGAKQDEGPSPTGRLAVEPGRYAVVSLAEQRKPFKNDPQYKNDAWLVRTDREPQLIACGVGHSQNEHNKEVRLLLKTGCGLTVGVRGA